MMMKVMKVSLNTLLELPLTPPLMIYALLHQQPASHSLWGSLLSLVVSNKTVGCASGLWWRTWMDSFHIWWQISSRDCNIIVSLVIGESCKVCSWVMIPLVNYVLFMVRLFLCSLHYTIKTKKFAVKWCDRLFDKPRDYFQLVLDQED